MEQAVIYNFQYLTKWFFFAVFFSDLFFWLFFFFVSFFLSAIQLIRFRHFPFGSLDYPWSNLDHGETLLVRRRINRGLTSPYLHLEMMSALQKDTICITENIGNNSAQPQIEMILQIGNYWSGATFNIWDSEEVNTAGEFENGDVECVYEHGSSSKLAFFNRPHFIFTLP